MSDEFEPNAYNRPGLALIALAMVAGIFALWGKTGIFVTVGLLVTAQVINRIVTGRWSQTW